MSTSPCPGVGHQLQPTPEGHLKPHPLTGHGRAGRAGFGWDRQINVSPRKRVLSPPPQGKPAKRMRCAVTFQGWGLFFCCLFNHITHLPPALKTFKRIRPNKIWAPHPYLPKHENSGPARNWPSPSPHRCFSSALLALCQQQRGLA